MLFSVFAVKFLLAACLFPALFCGRSGIESNSSTFSVKLNFSRSRNSDKGAQFFSKASLLPTNLIASFVVFLYHQIRKVALDCRQNNLSDFQKSLCGCEPLGFSLFLHCHKNF
jgi:hypothetical protein